MKDFIKKHNFNIIDIAGVLIIVMTFINENIAGVGFLIGFFVLGSLYVGLGWLAIIFAAVMNVVAYNAIKRDKRAGIFSVIFGGVIGAFVAIRIENPSYYAKNVITVIFRIMLWFSIYVLVSFSLFLFEYYTFSLGWK